MSETRGIERSGTKRALLVGDYGLLRDLLGVVLEHHAGFDECDHHAGSLAEARRAPDELRADRGSGWFDLAVVDPDLPGGGGLELLEALRKAAPGFPVLGTTADGDHGPRAQALRTGASEVLVLSASGKEMVAAAKRVGGWRHRHASPREPPFDRPARRTEPCRSAHVRR